MIKHVVIPSRLETARTVEEEVLALVAERGYDDSAAFAVRLAMEEALTNAIKHGNAGDETKPIHVEFDVTDQRIDIRVADEGKGFDPRVVPDPTADENLENPSGRGLMLMRAYMDEVCYNGRGNQVHMVKFNRKG